ncbi:restriction endonuclease subunit S [uncultured Lacinutrix sp.]|uniref:restriction endonuclease subunit S n=1 Tax=uncultured Lacinutrix sp. TaxID=574032 RepID=UPI00262476A7|nr:restriction endonuclease subunit S [uncultured Lacinutrix sp.]
MKLLQHFKELTVSPKNAKELKGLILQLAIQGKLTATWRTENLDIEPASELLKKIKKERIQLIKERKIKKEKPLSPITKDDIPCLLPESWVWKRLGEIVTLKSGTTFNKSLEETSGDYMYVKVGAMNLPGNENIITTSNLFVNSNDKIDKSLIPIRSIIFPKRGGAIATNKKRIVKEPILVDLNTMAIISPETFSFMYLKYWFDSIDLWSLNNGTSVPQINNKDIAPLLFSVPPLEEQKVIVKVVETLFKEVEQLEQLTVERISLKEDFVASALNQLTTNNANQEWTFLQAHFKSFFNETTNIKKLRETVLQLAVQGKLTADWRVNNPDTEDASVLLRRIQEEKAQLIKDKKIKKEKALPKITKEEIPYELPEGWSWCRLQDLEYLLGDGIHGTPEYTINGEYHFINGNNLSDGIIEIKPNTKAVSKEEFLKHKRILNDRTVLVSINGTIGNTAFYNNEKVMLGKSACYFNLLSEIDKEYIRQLIKSKYFLDYAFSSATQMTIKNVSLRTMRSFLVPLPSINEQKTIVQKVNALMGLCDALEQEVQQSQQYSEQLMQSCLREVFEGERKTVEV